MLDRARHILRAGRQIAQAAADRTDHEGIVRIVPACPYRRQFNRFAFDIIGRSQHGADIARRPVLVDLALDQIEIDARTANRFRQVPPAQLIDAGGLQQFDKGGVGGDDVEIAVGHHEGIGHLVDQIEHRRARRDHALAGGNQPNQQILPAILRKTGNCHRHIARPARQADARRADRVRHQRRADQRLHRIVRALVEHARQFLACKAPRPRADQRVGGRIGLANLQARRLDNQHRLGRTLEQHAVARFELAHPQIVAFERLLHLQQALLELARLAQIAAEGDAVGAAIDAQHGIADRHLAIAGGVIDLPPVLHLAAPGGGEHLHDFRATFIRHRLDPVAPDPACEGREFARIEGRIEDRAGVVEDQRDIACHHRKLHRRIGIERFEDVDRSLERMLAVDTVLAGEHGVPDLSLELSAERGHLHQGFRDCKC